jgi:hypothetical protein
MPLESSDFADQVDSPKAFREFLSAFRADRAAAVRSALASPPQPFGRGAGGWESSTIEEFLEAMEAYASDVELPEQPSWQFVAGLLSAGKIYE